MAHDIVVVAEDMKSKNSAIVVRKKDDPDALRIAEMLKGYVLERYPYYAKQVNVSKWADDIRLLHSVDGASYEAIEAIVRYLFEIYSPNSDFDWREQIRSGKNLRKHWIRLYELARKVYEKSHIETV